MASGFSLQVASFANYNALAEINTSKFFLISIASGKK